MRTFRLALMFAGGCAVVGCVDQNAVDTPQERVATSTPAAVQSVPGATPQALIQPLANAPQNLIDMQRRTYTDFANTMDFGVGRMIPPPGHRLPYQYAAHGTTVDFTQAYPPESAWHGYWKVEKVQLVGTVHNPEGAAYDTSDGQLHRMTAQSKQQREMAQQMKVASVVGIHSSGTPIREQTTFEKEALAELRSGTQMLVKGEPERLQVIGAIRAMGNTCKQCHQVPDGHLMGAFTYDLKRVKEKPELKPVSEVLP